MLKLLLSVILFPIALAVLIRMICATWKGLVYLLTCWQFWTVIGVILMIVALSYQVHAVVNSVKRDGDYQYLRALQVNWPLIERARTWHKYLGDGPFAPDRPASYHKALVVGFDKFVSTGGNIASLKQDQLDEVRDACDALRDQPL